jgi:hypothetical protein
VELKEMKLFSNIGVEDSGNVIDKVCCKVPWLLYGSRKTEENHPYKLTKIYDASLNKISIDKAVLGHEPIQTMMEAQLSDAERDTLQSIRNQCARKIAIAAAEMGASGGFDISETLLQNTLSEMRQQSGHQKAAACFKLLLAPPTQTR